MVESLAVWGSVNVWTVEGRGRLVVNVHEWGKHWESSIAKKESRRGCWITWWVVGVEGIAHGCLPLGVAGRESKRVSISRLADNALEGPNARVMGMVLRGGEGVGVKWAAGRGSIGRTSFI